MTKNPHYVPKTYLAAWANDRDQVGLRRRAASRAHRANIVNVAVERGIYGRGDVGQRREDLFGLVEQKWPQLRDDLTFSGPAVGQDRRLIALYAGLQIARTREHMAQSQFVLSVAEAISERPVTRESVRIYLADKHLGFAPSEDEIEAAWTLASFAIEQDDVPTRDELLGASLDIAVSKLAPLLEAFTWTVETCVRPILYTCDRPVMLWHPPSLKDVYRGLGLQGAHEIRLPLSPRALLVMRRRPGAEQVERVLAGRFHEVNRTTTLQCFEFIVGTVSQEHALTSLSLTKRRPALRFNQRPGIQVNEDGRTSPMGDIIHAWVPSPCA